MIRGKESLFNVNPVKFAKIFRGIFSQYFYLGDFTPTPYSNFFVQVALPYPYSLPLQIIPFIEGHWLYMRGSSISI